jgi:hypothetical protein
MMVFPKRVFMKIYIVAVAPIIDGGWERRTRGRGKKLWRFKKKVHNILKILNISGERRQDEK